MPCQLHELRRRELESPKALACEFRRAGKQSRRCRALQGWGREAQSCQPKECSRGQHGRKKLPGSATSTGHLHTRGHLSLAANPRRLVREC
mmetsp:Transcript_66553/g.177251  ORF Transcript_66553/g.177251 Transcript_66553/m.177251 type:complete len:91 (-) Transcript_66553:23-295(-)